MSLDSTTPNSKKSLIKTIPKQISNLRRRITLSRHSSSESFEYLEAEDKNLLEDVEPVAGEPTTTSTSTSTPKERPRKKAEDLSKLDIPSSLLTLNDEEKRRLEDVLMRIGLKEVGL